ncbi:MAG: hypothetical protein JSS98_10575 [Bacteroidetes bacterium]|nr:hypothetical protein [Bacteroidota bacterium]
MSISIYNSTNVPLAPNDSFVGRFDDISQFAEIMISIQCDGNFRLLTQYSTDKNSVEASTITDYPPQLSLGDVLLLKLEPKARYFKLAVTSFSLDPNKLVPMTYLRVQTIYKLRQTYSADGVNANVSNMPTDYATQDTLDTVAQTLAASKTIQTDSKAVLQSMNSALGDIKNNSATTNSNLEALDSDVKSGFGTLDNDIKGLTSALSMNNLNVVVVEDTSKFAEDILNVDGNSGFSNSLVMATRGTNLTIYGNCIGADTQLTIQVSHDGNIFYNTSIVENIYSGQDFCIIAKLAAKYVRIATSPAFSGVMYYAVSV